ncbi:methyltransferase family protein [Thiobacter aerophilum]|uniref:Methanethiol S-methyltransferase n=1 Tax=Thiobacter aerophilum TaxID=3121275 RepID=A0ABV0EF96_9BURK
MIAQLALIAGAWLAYGALHSVLASHACKQWVGRHWPRLLSAYRLLFNLVAVIALAPPLWLTGRFDGPVLWQVPTWIAWPALVVAGVGFAWSMRWYDGATFLGLPQWRRRIGPDDAREAFTISPLHRYVRHPWYAMGLILLWTRNMNAAWLTTAVVITLYLLIGSRLEENKLMALYGEAYRRYRARVPALIPWPGRSLTQRDAQALEALARSAAS